MYIRVIEVRCGVWDSSTVPLAIASHSVTIALFGSRPLATCLVLGDNAIKCRVVYD